MNSSIRFREFAFLSITCIVALVQMVCQLALPGPYFDEAAHCVYAIWILRGEHIAWGPPFVYFPFGIPVLGSLGYYVGPLQGYLVLLLMYLSGISTAVMRIIPILFMTMSLPFVFFFMRNRFGNVSAYVTTLLFVFQPSLLLWSRVGLYPFSILVFFICSSIYFLNRWLCTGNSCSLVIGFFMLGLGLQTFITFAWYVLALGMTTIVMRLRTGIRMRQIPLMIGGFLGGIGPYLLPWVSGDNIRFFIRFAIVSHAGISNLLYADNLLLRIRHLGVLIEGSGLELYGGTHPNHLAIPIFAGSVLGTVLAVVLSRVLRRRRLTSHLFLLLMFFLMLIQTPITISSLNHIHMIPLLPISLMIVGSFLGQSWNVIESKWSSSPIIKARILLGSCKILLLITLSFSIVPNLVNVTQYQADLKRTGGVGSWSNGIEDSANYLVTANYTYVLIGDWGISYGLFVASKGKLRLGESLVEIFWLQDKSFQIAVERYLEMGSVCFIFWRNSSTGWSKLELLQKSLANQQRSLVLDKTFHQRDGVPVIDIYRVNAATSSVSQSQIQEIMIVDCASDFPPRNLPIRN